jgi:hypothetical protein
MGQVIGTSNVIGAVSQYNRSVLVRRKPSQTALRMESLETRQALAGDVTVFAIGDTLHIRGDSADNGLAIYSPSEGVLNVAGINQGGSATTVNDVPTQAFTGINTLIIDLNGGNDALVITDAAFKGSISIQTGEGNDVVGLGEFSDDDELFDDAVDSLLGALTIEGNLVMLTGNGNDSLSARNLNAKLATVAMEGGNDSVRLDRNETEGHVNYIPGVTTTGPLVLALGEGDNEAHLVGVSAQSLAIGGGDGIDEIDLDDVTVSRGASIFARDGANEISIDGMTAKSLAVSVGLGNDQLELENLTLKKSLGIIDNFGDDTISVEDTSAKSIGIASGVGNDTVTVRNLTLTGKLAVNTGIGNDSLTLENVTEKNLTISLDAGDDTLSLDNAAIAKNASISAGLGTDQLTVERLSAASLTTTLGVGDDALSMQFVVIAKKAKIDGEQGENTFTDLGNNTFGRLDRRNFADLV